MKDYFKILLLVVVVFSAKITLADTEVWNFNTPGEYSVSDANEAEVAEGVGKLIGTVTPSFLGNYNTDGSAEDVVVSDDGNTLYIADQNNGLQIVDISDPALPVFLGEYVTVTSNTRDLVLSSDEQTAYLADSENGLIILDISDPTDPLLVNHYTDFSVDDVHISSNEDTAYLSSVSSGLVILDISNPANPVYINNYDTAPRSARVAAISPNETTAYLYISGIGGGLYILDISDPMNIAELGDFQFSASQNMILSDDENTIFSSGSAGGLFIIDVSDPMDPTLISQYDSTGFVADIAISSDEYIAYLADGANGLTLIDISDPSNPEFLLSFDSSGNARGIHVSSDGTRAYLADSADGVDIINLDTSYSSDSPYVTPISPLTFATTLDSFSETLGLNNEGSVSYQLSTDDGATWYYWDGSDWTETLETDGSETSTVNEVTTNIPTLDTDGGDFLWRAYFNSDGEEQVELDEVTVEGTFEIEPEPEPENPSSSSTRSSRRLSQEQIDQIFGTPITNSSSDQIYQLQMKLISLLTQLITLLKS